jgi:hypothetical protein
VKRRFFGSILIGLGVLFATFAVGLPFYVAPSVMKLPYDMRQCPPPDETQPEGCLKPSVAEADNATFLDRSAGQIRQGRLRSITWVVPEAEVTAAAQGTGTGDRLTDDSIVWSVYGEANWVDGGDALISAYSTQFALDRVSGAAVDWDGQWLNEDDLQVVPRRNVAYQGQTYKFPFGTQKIDYQMFDRDLRRALPATFVDVATVEGLEAYHFRSDIPAQEAQNVTPASLETLRSVFAPEATTVRVMYSNTREVWVDPVTGAFLDVREQQKKVLVPDTGPEVVLLEADFRYTPETITNSTTAASNNHSRLKLVTLYGPVVFGLLALLAIIGGLLLVTRRARPAREPGGWDASLPKPRHRLRGDGTADDDALLTDTVPRRSPSWSSGT